MATFPSAYKLSNRSPQQCILGVFEFVSVRSFLISLIVGVLLLLVQSVRVRWEASPLSSQ